MSLPSGLLLSYPRKDILYGVTCLIYRWETYWNDIEEAIRYHTAKFIFVLSKTSNTKQGALDEYILQRLFQRSRK
jgi:hypothetical protein